jgi:SAM-dependent methyltransferase
MPAPAPSTVEGPAKVEERYADLLELAERAHADHFWYHGFRSFVGPVLADVAGGRTNLRIVDCGCGTGHNLELLARHGRVVGFDLTPGGLARARARGEPVARGDITRVPFRAETFDLATSFDVMQSVEHDREAVREIARLLKPEGAAVITMAALEALRGDHSDWWREIRRYTPSMARALAEQAGLRVERVQFLFASLVPPMLAVRTVQRIARPLRRPRLDADIAVPSPPINALLTWAVRTEAAITRRVPMPFGSSLLLVARKPG